MTVISNNQGNLKDSARYYPYGGRRVAPTHEITDSGYTGHKHNDDLGLIYMVARYYDPALRRFISADTIVPDMMDTGAYNRFAYVNNNPVNFNDPTGHCAEFGDDECWSVYDQITAICLECADMDLWQYGKSFLLNYLNNLAAGWRPSSYQCSGREDCYQIINTWLSMLAEAGPLGQQLASYLRRNGVRVEFVDDVDWTMRLAVNMIIQVSNRAIDRLLGLGGDVRFLFTAFGHEIVHHQQGYINAVSIQGEYLAYRAQIELARNWDRNHGTNTASISLFSRLPGTFADWDALAANLDPNSYDDMSFFKEYFFGPGGDYRWTPIFPWPYEFLRNAKPKVPIMFP